MRDQNDNTLIQNGTKSNLLTDPNYLYFQKKLLLKLIRQGEKSLTKKTIPLLTFKQEIQNRYGLKEAI
jgi:hypothetical protein